MTALPRQGVAINSQTFDIDRRATLMDHDIRSAYAVDIRRW